MSDTEEAPDPLEATDGEEVEKKPLLDEQGNPVLDEDGNPVMVPVEEEEEEEEPQEEKLRIDPTYEPYKQKQMQLLQDRKTWEISLDESQKKVKYPKSKGKKAKKKMQMVDVFDFDRIPLATVLLPELIFKKKIKC